MQGMASLQEIDPRLRDLSTNVFQQKQRSDIPIATPPLQPETQSQHYVPLQEPLQNQATYLPQSPHSGDNTGDHDGGPEIHDEGVNDPKRPRACEACRGLKVRCDPDPNDPEGPCKRCAKAKRKCVVTAPSRKRQKKTDNRVAELERKIDALTASLHASKSGPSPHTNGESQSTPFRQMADSGYNSHFSGGHGDQLASKAWATYPSPYVLDAKGTSATPTVMAGQKRKHMEDGDYATMTEGHHSAVVANDGIAKAESAQQQLRLHESSQDLHRPTSPSSYADVIDRGLISEEMATQMFNIYVERMAPHMPAVVFPAATTALQIRRGKPTLFLAILSASSGTNYPSLQLILTKEIMSIYAERIICKGDKSLELIQALHVSTLWYWPPEHFEELKFYQLIHIAAVMAIDIGLGKRLKASKSKSVGTFKEHPVWRRAAHPDPESSDARRAWLTCYFLCCNASMGLRRPNLIRWSPFMGECVNFLETSPKAMDSDRLFCQWIRSQHIAEDIGTQFSMDDPIANVSIADTKVQFALKGFERDLEKWSSQVPHDVQNPSLKMTEHVVNLYMHEVAMHVDHNVETFNPPFTEEGLRGVSEDAVNLTPAHISALSICLTSIDGIFETFLKFDVETIRCMPIAQFVRVAYAVVVLIKMYFAAATANSDFGKVINKDNMKVEQYLNGLVDIFRRSAAEEKSRPAAKFLLVLVLLKQWFNRQRESKTNVNDQGLNVAEHTAAKLEPLAETPNESKQALRHPTQQRQQPGYSPANTPLQLLSEVATGNSSGQARADTSSAFPSSTNEWQQQLYQHYETMNEPHLSMQQGYFNIDPALGAEPGYSMGIGFEQAMGMTLGGGDCGAYFGDDAFFGNLIDSAQQGGYEGR